MTRQTTPRWLHGTYTPTTRRRWWLGLRRTRLPAVGGYITLSWGIAGRGRYIGVLLEPTLAAQLRFTPVRCPRTDDRPHYPHRWGDPENPADDRVCLGGDGS